MPLVRSEDSPQVPDLLGPKYQISVWSSLMSWEAMLSYPSVLMAPVSGSQMASVTNLISALVSGEPSENFKPFFSLMVTSMCVLSTFLTIPLSVVGTSLTRSGIGLFCASNTHNAAQMGPEATSWVVAADVERTFRSSTDSQSEKTSWPPWVPFCGL